MDWAARAGHLEVVKFLSENRNEGCTTDAINWAARAGHLEVVKFLSENRGMYYRCNGLGC
jgi:ankyrin repeat protein